MSQDFPDFGIRQGSWRIEVSFKEVILIASLPGKSIDFRDCNLSDVCFRLFFIPKRQISDNPDKWISRRSTLEGSIRISRKKWEKNRYGNRQDNPGEPIE
jgi:hypothetical protein